MGKREIIKEWIKQEQGKHFCQCGCRREIMIIRNHFYGGIPKYKHGHNPGPHLKGRTPWNKKSKIKIICQGCGKEFGVIPSRKDSAKFHSKECYSNFKTKQFQNLETHPRYMPEKYAWIEENQGKHFCQCGCGQPTKIEEWHYRQGIPKYLRNHGQFSKEVKQKIREARMKQKPFPKYHTKPELVFEEICRKYNLHFKYTGDGSLWIGKSKKLNPDFIQADGQKIVIEIFGDWWHSPLLNPKLSKSANLDYRKRHYRQFKWHPVFLWESDLKREDTEQFVLNILQKEGVI